jgi:hypothetical protein
MFCFYNTKHPIVFLCLATVVASVITDIEIINMCTSKIDSHYFWKVVAKEMKCENEDLGP